MKTVLAILSLCCANHAAFAAATLTDHEKSDIVTAHNRWRSQLKIPPLKWSTSIANISQNYANQLKTSQDCNLSHSQANGLGENLFWASPLSYSDGKSEVQALTPKQVIDEWGNEKADYHYATNSCGWGKVCGHYTQIVWKDTTEVGCAKAVCADKSQVWVCNYKPAGNFIGVKPY